MVPGENVSKAIRIHEHGGPDVLGWEDFPLGTPGEDEVLIRHTAIGVNFSDLNTRRGLMPGPLPCGLGSEAAGTVLSAGNKVEGFKAGDRIAYMHPVPGAYSENRVLPADALIKLPDDIADETAAATLLKGLTAHFLIRRCYAVQPGDLVLLHAAAGGLGLIAGQWLKALGATVIGVVSTEAKAQLARAHGCDHTLLSSENLAERVRELTDGAGVHVVYDSVGKDTFMASLECLRRRGMMVSFGNTSGPPPEISPMLLMMRGSIFLTRPSGADYLASRAEREAAASELFSALRRGEVTPHIGQRYALRDAASAHRDIEARRTVGSSLLLP